MRLLWTRKNKVKPELNNLAGLLAEDQVREKYERSGFEILKTRFRCLGGEIDLIARHDAKIYFVEVKKSVTHERAAERINARKRKLLMKAANAFLVEFDLPQNTDIRFDAALVDQAGQIKVIPNAFL